MIFLVRKDRSFAIERNDFLSMEFRRMLDEKGRHGLSTRDPLYFDARMGASPPKNGSDHSSVEVVDVPDDMVHPMARWMAEEGRIRDVVVAGRWRLFEEYGIDHRDAFCVMGSWRYGLEDSTSDYDLGVVTFDDEGKRRIRRRAGSVAGGAAVAAMTVSELSAGLRTGSRVSWEIATSPPELSSRRNDPLATSATTPFDLVKDALDSALRIESWTDEYAKGSVRYVRTYAPMLTGLAARECDPWVRRWKAKAGWAYKLGYYLVVDAIICRDVLANKRFDPGSAVRESGMSEHLLRLKHGEVCLEEWTSCIKGIMTKQAERELENAL
jgi:hypothetical protein